VAGARQLALARLDRAPGVRADVREGHHLALGRAAEEDAVAVGRGDGDRAPDRDVGDGGEDRARGAAAATGRVPGLLGRGRARGEQRDAGDTATGELGPGHDGGDLELRDWVAKGLRLLPEDQRTTMELAYLAGLSCAEIGQLMGCAEGTVKARMFHARLRLRNLMPALGGLVEQERERS